MDVLGAFCLVALVSACIAGVATFVLDFVVDFSERGMLWCCIVLNIVLYPIMWGLIVN